MNFTLRGRESDQSSGSGHGAQPLPDPWLPSQRPRCFCDSYIPFWCGSCSAAYLGAISHTQRMVRCELLWGGYQKITHAISPHGCQSIRRLFIHQML